MRSGARGLLTEAPSSSSRPHTVRTRHQAFVSCRLDYYNSLLYINVGLLRRLQYAKNAAGRQAPTLRLRKLLWLPVHQRVIFKVAGLVRQSFAEQRHRTSPMIVACSQIRVGAHAGRLQMTSELWLFPEHTTDSATETVLQLVLELDCGMTVHPDYGDQICPSRLFGSTSKLRCSIEAEAHRG